MSNLTPPSTATPGKGLAITGIVLGFFLPPVGIVLGIIAVAKRNVTLGSVAIGFSLLVWAAWVLNPYFV